MSEPNRTPYAWVRCLGGELRSLDVGTGGLIQHITPHPTELLLLPLAVCKFLLTNRPTRWEARTIVPSVVGTVNDPATNLEVTGAVTTDVWGVGPKNSPYWDDAGVDGADAASLTYDPILGTIILEGGFGQSVPPRGLERIGAQRPRKSTIAPWWSRSKLEALDGTLTTNEYGDGEVFLPVPPIHLDRVEIPEGMSQREPHEKMEFTTAPHDVGVLVRVRHAHPDQSIVVRCWRHKQ